MWLFLIIFILISSILIQIYIITNLKNANLINLYIMKIFNFIQSIKEKIFFIKTSEYEKEKETYFATLVHDLKTPANAQIRTLKMLLDGYFGILNSEQAQIIKETLNSEKYMAEIVSDILTAYKCDNSNFKLKLSTFDLPDELNEIYKIMKTLADEKQQQIIINYNCSQLYISADKLQISRVISNLISNAIKYGFSKSVIKIDLNINSSIAEFTVENQGYPIHKEKLSKIFEKFSGNKSTCYNSASTGLGLYLSKKIIDLHGGKIFAKSDKSGKIVFGFRLKTGVVKNMKSTKDITSKSFF